MKPKDDIERLVQSVRATTSAAVDEHILSDATKALTQAVPCRSAVRPTILRIGLQTMQRHWRPAAAAIAAAVTIAVMLVVLRDSASPVYALEQTLQASHSVRSIHFKLEGLSDKENPIEIWARFSDVGELLQARIDSVVPAGHKQAVWQNDKAEMLLVERNRNLYGVQKDQSIANRMRDFTNDFDPKNIVSQLQQLQMRGRLQMDIKSSTGTTDPVVITATFAPDTRLTGSQALLHVDPDRIVLTVDPQTKLVSMLTMYKHKEDEYCRLGDIKFLEYNQPIDPAKFKLNVPEGAITFDQYSQSAGLAQGNMTDTQAAMEVTRRFFEALIARDFATAGSLYQGIAPGFLEDTYGKATFVRIVSIGEPTPCPEVQGFRVPCEVEIEYQGKSELLSRNAWVRQMHLHPDRWTICGGI